MAWKFLAIFVLTFSVESIAGQKKRAGAELQLQRLRTILDQEQKSQSQEALPDCGSENERCEWR